jgi:pyrophosphatase PpaX
MGVRADRSRADRLRADRPRAILFDLDGTLLDTSEVYRLATRYILDKYLGSTEASGEVDRLWGLPLDVIMARLHVEASKDMVRDFVAFYMANHAGRVHPYPGVPQALEALLAGGQRVAIVTSKRRVPAESDLELAGLAGMHDVLVCHEDVKSHKPDPAALLLALERLACPARAALMVGDSVVDVEAGRAARIPTAAALWGTLDAPSLLSAGPDYALKTTRDLEPFCIKAPAWLREAGAGCPGSSGTGTPAPGR